MQTLLIRISILKQKVISRPIATLAIFSIFVVFGVLAGIVYSQGDPSAPQTNPGSNFQVCTGGVNQDACYNSSSSITRLNWTYSSSVYGQMAFWVQVDNNGDLNGNFPSPEINTGWINSSNIYYDILPGSLQPNTTYYWKVAAADTHSSWSGWTCADASFTTPSACALPTCSSATPDGDTTTANTGTRRAYANGVSSDATSVSFPTWSDPAGQDDLIWYPGTNAGGGTWYADINLASHPGLGTINVHVYMNSASYSNVWCDTANFVRVAPPTDDAKFISQSVPTTMYAGETASVSIAMQNCRPSGDCSNLNTWLTLTPTGDSYRLITLFPYTPSIRNGVDWWGAQDIALSNNVAVGSSNTFTFNITAPSTPGTYNFQWIMLQGGVSPFGEFTPNVLINVVPTLTVSKAGTGSGTVTSAPAGINCGSNCSENYTSGTSVTLTASAASDSTFSGWSGEGCSGTGTCTVTMTQARNVTATFNAADFSLTKTSDIYATIVNKQAAESSKTTIKVTPLYGFNSAVVLTVESVIPQGGAPPLPVGTTYYFSDSTLSSSEYSTGSEFKVNIGSGLTSSGIYRITIKGTSVSPARENTVTVDLNAQVKSPGWEEF